MSDTLIEGATNVIDYRPGLSAYTSPRGARVMVLRLEADDDHTPEWQVEERRRYTTKDWRREMEGDWSTPAGDPFFPQFSELGRDKYVWLAKRLIQGPVFRSYDTGRRRPAVTFFQYSPKSDRIWGLREFMPHDLQTHEFRDAVRYLSGQLAYEALPDRARRWVDFYAARPSGSHCPPPWFPMGTPFIDIGGGNEVNNRGASAERPDEASFVDIFRKGGIEVLYVNPKVKSRNRLVDRMLMIGKDGFPRTFLDPQMEETITGFEGAFSYPQETASNPIPDEPKNDGHYINLLDAWGYGVSAVVPDDTPEGKAQPRIIGLERDGRTPIWSNPDNEEDFNWYEARLGRRR